MTTIPPHFPGGFLKRHASCGPIALFPLVMGAKQMFPNLRPAGSCPPQHPWKVILSEPFWMSFTTPAMCTVSLHWQLGAGKLGCINQTIAHPGG
ncbi:hypothetical protein AAFF_G00062290 [Aldrovandia affinis]|uniref:Uncharacterized protein n=1 Tax=Aldrovandia affinis TaxID=143900 RepID=A0AAD7WE17_9TELE|nr:hypothetical protein AAFF_G00062290 [Aldrovandia affinis]